jgi:uncharacterized membrane protein
MGFRNAMLATAVAGLFLAGGAATAFADQQEKKTEAEKVKCDGANGCKGKSACATTSNECAGKNGCAGKGFMMMTAEECAKAKEAAKPKAN